MPIASRRLARAKAARVTTEWPSLDDTVFETLGVTRDELVSLEHELLGQIILPGMAGYDEMEVGADGLSPYRAHPEIVVRCVTFNDVRLCLEWARKNRWWVTCRAGGHSTAGFSVNNGLVIDVSGISYAVVDPVAKQARAGAGTRFHQLNSVLNTYRLHVPGGTCTDVGIAGYMQGGGYGLTSREFGMNCDNVVSVTVMLADGRIVIANADKNQDLFWAIRGGTGGNFGVLLEVTYRLYDLYQLYGFVLQWPISDAPAALAQLQRGFMANANANTNRLGYMLVMATLQGQPMLVMVGMYDGDRSEAMDAIAPLLNIGHPTLTVDRMGTYADLNESLPASLVSAIPPNIHEWKASGYIATTLEPSDWEQITAYFATAPNPLNMVVIEPYGGAINAYPASDNAFIHRDVSMDFYVDSLWLEHGNLTHDAQASEWLAGFMERVRPHMTGNVYQNYPMRSFPDFRWAYWGEAFNSLLFVKQKYDPDNFFRFEQSITPYPDDPTITRATTPSRFSDPTIEYEPFSGDPLS